MPGEHDPLVSGAIDMEAFSPGSAEALRAARSNRAPTHASVINDLMDIVPYGRAQHRLLFSSAFIWLCMGMVFNVDALALSELQAVYSMTDVDAGALVSTIAAGILCGAAVAGILSDTLGRKSVTLVGIMFMIVVGFGKAWAPSKEWQMALRFVQGLATSCVWVPLPCLVAEQLPKSMRGPFTIIYAIGWPIGALLCSLLGQWLLPLQWQALYVVTTIPLILGAGMVACLTYESPRFYASIGYNRKALDTLTSIYNQNGHPKPTQFELGVWEDRAHLSERLSKAGKKTTNKSERGNKTNGWCMELFGGWGRLSIYMVWLACSAASWGATFWMPSYIERRVKLDALVAMSNADSSAAEIAQASSSTTTPFRMLIFTSLCDSVGIAMSANFVDKMGRTFIMKVGFASAAISLVVLTWVTGESWVLLCAGIMQFSQSLTWTVVTLYTIEAFASDIRSTAIGISNTIAKVGAISAPLLCGYLMQDNIHDAMLLCAGIYGFGWFMSFMLAPDRTGQKMQERF
jgi:MFS family permease